MKKLLIQIVKILKHADIHPSNFAHAYDEGRSIVTNASVHKDNFNFVNIDLTNFFPSITKEVIEKTIPRIYSLNGIYEDISNKDFFWDCILYKGALPQGAVTSPFLYNIVMIPFEYHLTAAIKENRRDIVLTRYADDITFSSKLKISTEQMLSFIDIARKRAYPDYYDFIQVNPKKTRLTTYKGKNRVTGVKINAENKLSIGYKEKQTLKMDMVSLIITKLRGEPIDSERAMETLGMFSYLRSVEPGYANYLLRNWSRKFGIDDVIKYLSN